MNPPSTTRSNEGDSIDDQTRGCRQSAFDIRLVSVIAVWNEIPLLSVQFRAVLVRPTPSDDGRQQNPADRDSGSMPLTAVRLPNKSARCPGEGVMIMNDLVDSGNSVRQRRVGRQRLGTRWSSRVISEANVERRSPGDPLILTVKTGAGQTARSILRPPDFDALGNRRSQTSPAGGQADDVVSIRCRSA
jgi:hypothetical protein